MRVPLRIVDLGFRVLNVVHRSVVRGSGGHVGTSALGMAVVELHTIGRSSGRPRSTMLTAPIVEGDRVVLIASKGGDDRDPDWYRNLVAHPDIELTIAGERRAMRARTASSEEKAVLWPRAVSVYKSYDSYQRRARREIPMVICESR